jgi:hypothetical protein
MYFPNPYPQYQQSGLDLICCDIWSVWPLNFRLCYAGARLRSHERTVLRVINQRIWKLCKYCIHHSRDKPAFNQSSFPTLWSKPTWDCHMSEWATASCNWRTRSNFGVLTSVNITSVYFWYMSLAGFAN